MSPRGLSASALARATVAPLAAVTLLACAERAGRDGAGESGGELPPDNDPSVAEGAALADSVLEAWIRAAGGLSAWDSVRSARYTVTTVWFDSAGAVRRMRPRRVTLRKTESGEQARIDRPEAEGLYVQAFDGDTAWALLNGSPLPADDPAAAEAEYVSRDVFYWFGLPYKLRDPGARHAARRLPQGGVEVTVTFGSGIGAHPGDRYFYYFLDEDPFPEEVHYIEQGYETRDRTLWSDFRSAGPIVYVGTRSYRDTAERPTKELRIADVVINPELPDSLFRPPSR